MSNEQLQKLYDDLVDSGFVDEAKDWAAKAVQLEDYGDGYGVWGLPEKKCPTKTPEEHLAGEFPMSCYNCHLEADS